MKLAKVLSLIIGIAAIAAALCVDLFDHEIVEALRLARPEATTDFESLVPRAYFLLIAAGYILVVLGSPWFSTLLVAVHVGVGHFLLADNKVVISAAVSYLVALLLGTKEGRRITVLLGEAAEGMNKGSNKQRGVIE